MAIGPDKAGNLKSDEREALNAMDKALERVIDEMYDPTTKTRVSISAEAVRGLARQDGKTTRVFNRLSSMWDQAGWENDIRPNTSTWMFTPKPEALTKPSE